MRSKRLAPALAASALLLAACGTSSGGESSLSTSTTIGAGATDPAPTSGDAAESVADSTAGNPADAVAVPAVLQFSAPLVGGGELDATSLAGKPTVFWFWAPT